ncbi:hypothetical protein ABIE17_001210 [Lelliottia nimipressuralis]|uniref:hypothetical protein n=1 Tax=Lelliottia TaxID=1330545 RepID=UPI00131EF5F2|nr:hypothetical protein [Lelliottia sp. WB101]
MPRKAGKALDLDHRLLMPSTKSVKNRRLPGRIFVYCALYFSWTAAQSAFKNEH